MIKNDIKNWLAGFIGVFLFICFWVFWWNHSEQIQKKIAEADQSSSNFCRLQRGEQSEALRVLNKTGRRSKE